MSNPTPTPVQVNPSDWTARLMALVAIVIGVYQIYYTHQVSPITPPVIPPVANLETVGHDWGVTLAQTYADGLHAGRIANSSGKPMEDVMQAISGTWNMEHTAQFKSKVYPTITAIVPDGQEPDAAGRTKLDTALGQLESGVRSVK